MRRAVIDIGTNSVKLLVAEVDGTSVLPLWEGSKQTRLGEGFFRELKLQPSAISQTAQAVAKFATLAADWGAASVRVIATSSARDAVNQPELLNAIQQTSGLTAEVISGQQEADWAYAGVRTDPTLTDHELLIIDIGGGSTELILGQGTLPVWRQSFPIGTVRLLEQIGPSDPPSKSEWARCREWLSEFLTQQVAPLLGMHLDGARSSPLLLVGTGGTTTILATMELGLTEFDREQIERVRLSRRRVWQLQHSLWSLSLAERRALTGLPPNRADVILFGVAVLALVMETLSLDQVRVSTRGLRFAAVGDGARL